MRTGLLQFGIVLSVVAASVAYGFSDPEGVPWAEWRFATDFDPAHEIPADKASDADSLIRRNPASAAVSISGGKVIFTRTGPADFLRVDVDDLVENGGGGYANAYTMIFDLKAMEADWLPVYNTGYNNYNAADFWLAADGSAGSGSYSSPGVVPLETWVRLVVVRRLEGGSWVRDAYVNGAKVLDNLEAEGLDGNGSLYTNAQQDEGQFTILSDSDATAYAGCELDNFGFVAAALSDEEVADLGSYRAGGIFGIAGLASEPSPADEAMDVAWGTTLAWEAGEFAATHDVYLGTSFDDVNVASRDDSRGALVGRDHAASEFAPAGIEFGRTYYWRIDEVNAAPDSTIFKGDVWSFTIEPFAYPIASVTATASSFQPGMGPEHTVDGSGLDELDRHSTLPTDMWMTDGATPAWIEFEFDQVYKVHEMWVWNSNQAIESFLGFGVKDVTIEYSLDGQAWSTLENVPEFAKASGLATYASQTTVSFDGVQARFVKLTINANWGGLAQTGLSEVRFFYVPLQAFYPVPADAAAGVSVEPVLQWRPGREAASHVVSIATDRVGVADGAVTGTAVTEAGYAPQGLMLATEYFWRVDEVSDAGTYAGAVWRFTTEEFTAVDDFEGYTDDVDARATIWQAWMDGWEDPDNGSIVGYSESPFAERTIVHGGRQSMPLAYTNGDGVSFSEATRTFESVQDWTRHGATTLVLYFHGDAANGPGSLYLKVNNAKFSLAEGDSATTTTQWRQWDIDLASAGVNLKNVKSIAVGVEGSGVGTLFVDDIRLYAAAPEVAPDATE